MSIEIVDRQPARVAYLRYTGPPGEPLAVFWRSKVVPWLADNGLLDCPRYGVMLDDPSRTPVEKRRYDACVELPPGLTLPESPEATIAGGRYAVTRFKGTGAAIGAAWGEFMRAILGDPARRIDPARPPFEHYPRGALMDTRTGVFACELCVPLSGQSVVVTPEVPSPWRIVRAGVDDAPVILDLQRLAYESEARLYGDWSIPPLTQTLESLRGEFAASVVLKCVDERVAGGRLVGSVRARGFDDTCQIGRLIVAPEFQGQGIGTRLMREIEAQFPATPRFELFTGSRSEANIRLYERLGYSRCRKQKLSPALTLVFMEKKR